MKKFIFIVGMSLAAQTADVQLIQDADSIKLSDAYLKIKIARGVLNDAELKFNEVKNSVMQKYKISDVEFSEDFKAAVPSHYTKILGSTSPCITWTNPTYVK